ncbi:hypothetical protein HUW46_05107 [Amycolatopsis sp. CA-230715]|nr:alpha/beta fold hydrolase [Amycolatopsis sp. CA-230715]QWF81674.1 hypothetical protein HUW46_05107 [Amycolatopsis sp. CA-230715]
MSTYLLVHGAWHSGRCWDRLTPLLTLAGHRVLVPSLTGYGDKAHLLTPEVGLDTHVDDIVRLILDEDLTDVVLVGHSYAGPVISSAANEVPEDGESAADVLPVTKTGDPKAAGGCHRHPNCRRACSASPIRSPTAHRRWCGDWPPGTTA